MAYPEGEEIKPVPDNLEIILNMLVEPIQDKDIIIEDCDIDEKEDTIIDYSESLIDEEATNLTEENTPCLGNNQLLLEQTNSIILAEQTNDSPTLPHIILKENLIIDKLNEDDDYIELFTEKSENIEQKSVEPPETVDSLEIASHQQESNLTLKQDFLPLVEKPLLIDIGNIEDNAISQDVSTFEKENGYTTKNFTVVGAYKKNNGKAGVIVKGKSAHSLIPRKQYASSVIEENPVAISSKPLTSNVTTSSNHNEFNTSRRGSSSSFIPTFQQQNRLSLIITENSTNYKNWSPSSSCDSLPKSLNSIPSSASTSSSGSSGTNNTTTKEKKSSMKSHKLSTTNTTQHSKIPVVTVALFHTSSDIPKGLPAVSNINNFSRLPKRNSANI